MDHKFSKIIKNFSNQRVLVIGDIGLDCYTHGLVERISPEAPVPIVSVKSKNFKLGLASNVAENLKALSCHCQLLGISNMDPYGIILHNLLIEKNIPTDSLIMDPSYRTILKERIVSSRQQLLRIDYDPLTAISQDMKKKLLAQLHALGPSWDAIIIEDYAKGLLDEDFLQHIIAFGKKNNTYIAIDPNPQTPCHFYRNAQLLTPNTKEAEILSGISIYDTESLRKAGIFLLDTLQLEALTITRGEQGVALFKKGSTQLQLIPTTAKEVYDVSGAGDTFITVMTLSVISGASLFESTFLANLAAGIEVGKFGTATVNAEEMLQFLDHSQPTLNLLQSCVTSH